MPTKGMNTGWVGEIAPSSFMVPFTVVILGLQRLRGEALYF